MVTVPMEDRSRPSRAKRRAQPHRVSAALLYIRTHGREAALQLSARLQQPGADGSKCRWEASHFCHDPSCSMLGHVLLEPHEANKARKNCMREVQCHSCGCTVNACPHQPRCLRPAKWLRDKRAAMAAAASLPATVAGGADSAAA
jgi:Zinc-binding loop region of homing endonuclease